jgi:hypothetical protein
MEQNPKKTLKDSIDMAKSKSGSFSKKDFSRKDFGKKVSPLTDSSTKYSNIVFDAAKNMSNEDLSKKGISKSINSKGDTVYKYNSNGLNFEQVRGSALKAMKKNK